MNALLTKTVSWFKPALGAVGNKGFATRLIVPQEQLEEYINLKIAEGLILDKEKSTRIEIPAEWTLPGDAPKLMDSTYKIVEHLGTKHICSVNPTSAAEKAWLIVYSRSAWRADQK